MSYINTVESQKGNVQVVPNRQNSYLELPPESPWNYPMDEWGLKDDQAKTTINYTIQEGDNIGLIAMKFDCSVDDLKRWNGSSISSRLKPGQRVMVRVLSEYVEIYKNIEARKREIPDEDKNLPKVPYLVHYVLPNETLNDIALKHSVSEIDVRIINGFDKYHQVKDGDQIFIPKK